MSSTKRSSDLGSLVASSSSLLSSSQKVGGPKLGSGACSPALKRSLRELSVASSSLGAPSSHTPAAAEASAYRLLAREGGGFDALKLGRSARELELYGGREGVRREEEKDGRAEEADLESLLRANHDRIVSRALVGERERIERDVNDLIRGRLLEMHEMERTAMLKELAGYRVPAVSTAQLAYRSEPSLPEPVSRPGMPTIAQQRDSSQAAVAAAFGAVSTLSESLRRHAALVATLNANRDNPGLTPEALLSEFQALAESLLSEHASSNPAIDAAYANAWGLLRSMVGDQSSNSAIIDPAQQQQTLVKARACGTLAHICRQFRDHIVNRARSAALSNTQRETPNHTGFVQDVADYVQLQMGGGGTLSSHIWRRLYYCFRCGDANAALQTLNTAQGANMVEQPVAQLTSLLARHQGSNKSLWETYTVPSIPNNSRQPVADLYHRSKANPNSTEDHYKIATLCLLSLTEPFTSSPIIQTIEDYLFASLWTALHEEPSCKPQIVKLAQLIKHWGPSHFDDHSSNGWAYAIPLLASQQFFTALTHLAEHGSLLHACHLAIGTEYAGVEIVDLDGNKNHILTTLLVSFSVTFQGMDPGAALEYLVRIPDSKGKTGRKHIVRLLLETRAFEILAGGVAPDGTRTNGALDSHFSRVEVSFILTAAAEKALQDGNVKDGAELLALAGRYGSLISVLNRELSGLLAVPKEEEEMERRKFWREAAIRFHSDHIARGQTHVIKVLEDEDNLSLANTFQLIMNLMVFFDKCHEAKYEEAWSIVSNLNLLPQTEDEMSYKIESFHCLDNVIKQSFHLVILAALETLQQQHAGLKSHTDKVTGAVEQRLGELRKKASLIVTFAGLIQINSSEDAKIARMEAFMM